MRSEMTHQRELLALVAQGDGKGGSVCAGRDVGQPDQECKDARAIGGGTLRLTWHAREALRREHDERFRESLCEDS